MLKIAAYLLALTATRKTATPITTTKIKRKLKVKIKLIAIRTTAITVKIVATATSPSDSLFSFFIQFQYLVIGFYITYLHSISFVRVPCRSILLWLLLKRILLH